MCRLVASPGAGRAAVADAPSHGMGVGDRRQPRHVGAHLSGVLAAVTAETPRPDRLVTRRARLEDVCVRCCNSPTGGPGITVVEMQHGRAGNVS